MALILALNPGNSHSPTLSRLARELHGCELIGAESCIVAISAIKKRVPDIVLLPAREARGEADLIAHLESVPGGVLTLKLPPVESANPVDLARRIREMLTGVSASADAGMPGVGAGPNAEKPVGTSPHLLAAATAAITWIRRRRAQWIEERPADISPAPLPQWTGVSRSESDKPYEPIEPAEDDEPDEPIELDDSDALHDPHATHDLQGRAPRSTQLQTWLPRAAALAAVIGVTAAVVSCWPQIRGGLGSAPDQTSTPGEASPAADVNPTPVRIRVTSNEPAEVWIDGTRVGDTPYDGTVDVGTHAVTVRSAGAERQLTVAATSKPVQLEVDFSKP